MKPMRSIILFAFLLVFVNPVFAQSLGKLITQGVNAYSTGDYQRAALAFEKALKIDTNISPNFIGLLIESYRCLGLTDRAIMIYSKCEDRVTPLMTLKMIRIFAEEKGDNDKAIKLLSKLKENNFDSPEMYAGIANIFVVEGKKKQAVDTLKYGLRSNPQSILLPMELVRIAVKYDDIVSVQKAFEIIRVKPYEFQYCSHELIDISRLSQKLQKTAMTEWLLKKAFELDSTSIDLLYEFASIYDKNQDYSNELRILNKIADSDTTCIRCLQEIIKLIRFLQPDDAIKTWDLLFKRDSTQNKQPAIDLFLSIAEKYKKDGKYDDAIAYYEKANSFSSGNSKINLSTIELCLSIAEKYKKDGKYDDAIAYYIKANTALGGNPDIDLIIAKLFFQKKDFQQARSHSLLALNIYTREMEKDPLNASGYIKTGLCYLVMNDLTNAEGEFQKHLNRADITGKEEAGRKLKELAQENINRPDVEYLLQKYYGQYSTEAQITQGDTSKKSTPKLVEQMMIEFFGESSKINTEQDKAYILIHSQIPDLRFDSNRKIHQVNQLSSGDWELWLPAGTHILKIIADGYQRLELPPMNFGKKRSYEMTIKVATGVTEP